MHLSAPSERYNVLAVKFMDISIFEVKLGERGIAAII